jgi:formate hydrogenlyase subunit 3/multisubunit Na+/H+ antiporter MnhD subunit
LNIGFFIPEKKTMTQKVLILLGIVLIAVGVLWPWLSQLGLGKLPGDIIIRRDNFKFYFPITTCILISVFLTFMFWLFRKF